MTITLHLQIATIIHPLPSRWRFKRWLAAMAQEPELASRLDNSIAELTIRIVDEAESAELNEQYRHKQGPTNVLSFPAEIPDYIAGNYLGDLAICAPLVLKEAAEQDKAVMAHWAHLTLHGVLHLLGYDHIEERDADVMEALEIRLLQGLKFSNPYEF